VPPKQVKHDLSLWSLLDTYTVEEAACLWADIDPIKPPSDRTKFEMSKFTPIYHLLSRAAKDGTLPVDTSNSLFADCGDYSSSQITRHDLTLFAYNKREKPVFLFNTSTPKVGVNETPDTGNGLPAKPAGRPPICKKEVWLERFAILSLQGKVSLGDSQDAIAAVLSEDLEKQGIRIKASSIKRDWIGPIVSEAKIKND
jgi:hypothetical protein